MGKKTKRKKNEGKKEGEVFYRAHPIAQPMGGVAHRESKMSITVERGLWRILGIVEAVLLLRIVVAVFGADGGNIITSFIYAVSYPFVWFFFYLFNTLGRVEVTAPTFEIETLAAMAFYYIVVYIITQLIVGFRETE
ncbi:MAG: hypothetical protein AAB632_02360 [Patescibacteria group bacterium]